jgi:hypothetical protein
MIGETGYFAEQDGPLLVAFAKEHPYGGDQYLKQYLTIHTNYNYVEYRNESLLRLLRSVLHHPSQEWVKTIILDLTAAALAGNRLDFQEAVPLTILALRAKSQFSGAGQEFEERRKQAITQLDTLTEVRGNGDTWGGHKRLLAALAQVDALLLDNPIDAVNLLQTSLRLTNGLAGFQVAVFLTLAETISICQPILVVEIEQALDAALAAAHNIQDAAFCAQSTARCNAMLTRWWQSQSFNVAEVVERLLKDPTSPEFTTIHRVGETYERRSSGSHGLRISEKVRQANTIRALAENVYYLQIGEIQRVNQNPARAADEPLPPGALVNLPDAGFVTWLAARFSAAALADNALTATQRVRLIQSLVPVAAINPTALDTVLSRLLLAVCPADTELLERMHQIAQLYTKIIGKEVPVTGFVLDVI